MIYHQSSGRLREAIAAYFVANDRLIGQTELETILLQVESLLLSEMNNLPERCESPKPQNGEIENRELN